MALASLPWKSSIRRGSIVQPIHRTETPLRVLMHLSCCHAEQHRGIPRPSLNRCIALYEVQSIRIDVTEHGCPASIRPGIGRAKDDFRIMDGMICLDVSSDVVAHGRIGQLAR